MSKNANAGLLRAGRPSGRTAEHVGDQLSDLDNEKRLNVIMPKSEYMRLKAFAVSTDQTVSNIVRNAVRDMMSKSEGQ